MLMAYGWLLCVCNVQRQLQCNGSTCSLQRHTDAPGTKTTPGLGLGLSLAAACRAQSRAGRLQLAVNKQELLEHSADDIDSLTLPCREC